MTLLKIIRRFLEADSLAYLSLDAMRVAVNVGMRSDLLMNQLLRIMANLMRPDAAGPAEIGYRALELISRLLPDPDVLENPAA